VRACHLVLSLLLYHQCMRAAWKTEQPRGGSNLEIS
jgi:hypothetical protein